MTSTPSKWRATLSAVLWALFVLITTAVLLATIAFAQTQGSYTLLFIGHIAGGTVFLGLGALQFLASVRNRYTRFHRINGRVMLVCAMVSIFFLYAMLPNSVCRACLPSQLAVTTVWLGSIIAAWIAIRRGDVAAHRVHMARGFVSASYFVMVRLVDHLVGVERLLPFVHNETTRVAISDWLVWVIPVLVVETVMRATSGAYHRSPNEAFSAPRAAG